MFSVNIEIMFVFKYDASHIFTTREVQTALSGRKYLS